MSERPVSEQAAVLADQLQAVVDQLPTYAARTPDLSIAGTRHIAEPKPEAS